MISLYYTVIPLININVQVLNLIISSDVKRDELWEFLKAQMNDNNVMKQSKRVRYSNVNVWKCPEVNVITLRHTGYCVSKRWALLFLLSLDWLIKNDWRGVGRASITFAFANRKQSQSSEFFSSHVIFLTWCQITTTTFQTERVWTYLTHTLYYWLANSYHEQSLGHNGREIIWMRGRQLEQSSDK